MNSVIERRFNTWGGGRERETDKQAGRKQSSKMGIGVHLPVYTDTSLRMCATHFPAELTAMLQPPEATSAF